MYIPTTTQLPRYILVRALRQPSRRESHSRVVSRRLAGGLAPTWICKELARISQRVTKMFA